MVERYDSVVVQLEPGLPVRSRAGRLERRLSLLAFSFALRRGHDVVIRLESPTDLPGGPEGGEALRVWRSAGRIILASDQQRADFVAAVGSPGESLPVSSLGDGEVDDGAGYDGGWGEGAEASAENVLELVRIRAAHERRQLADSDSVHVGGWDRLPAPGLAIIAGDSVEDWAVQARRRVARLARSALWNADGRPMLRPAATAVRAVRRVACAVVRPDGSD